MVDAAKAVTSTIPTIMAAGLVKHNVDYISKKKKKKSLINLGVHNIVGTSLISATAQAGSW